MLSVPEEHLGREEDADDRPQDHIEAAGYGRLVDASVTLLLGVPPLLTLPMDAALPLPLRLTRPGPSAAPGRA